MAAISRATRNPGHIECVITPYSVGGSYLPALLEDSGRWRNPRYSATNARPESVPTVTIQ